MLHLVLGSVGTFMSCFGVFTNLYVLLVLILSKKTRSSSEWILLHLSSCGLFASCTNLVCVGPSVFLEKWVAVLEVGCNIAGASILVLQLLIVWSICALSADRCAAIVSPLRYTQVVTRKKIAAFFIFIWVISISIVLSSFLLGGGEEDLAQEGISITKIVHMSGEETVIPQAVASHATIPYISSNIDNESRSEGEWYNGSGNGGPFEYRQAVGLCLPKMSELSVMGIFWTSVWCLLILVVPMATLLICDFTVLSIARKQRHRIIMALYQITAVTQVTVTGSKGTPPLPGLWMNRSVPARSRACRAVWEDMTTLTVLHLPLILILVLESILESHNAPYALDFIASLSFFATPSLTAIVYGIRARPLRAAYKSYLRKRLTNSTLQHEIQQRLSPVDGSPRLSSRIKNFRSASPSPTSSPIMTPRRLSTNDLRPPPSVPFMGMIISPSHGDLRRSPGQKHLKSKRKVRSFLHIPSQVDMQEFWSGLRRPNRSPTIVITHEIRVKDSNSSLALSPTAEQRL